MHLTTDFAEVLRSPDIDAVAIVTPVWTHFELAKAALENGKHVFVEKPFTSTSQQAEQLIELAERKNLRIMVDHTFLFSGAVRKIRELVDNGTLGPLYYFDSTRVNLGLFQHDVSVRVGSGAARPVDHGLPHRREARGGGRDRQQSPERPRRHGVHHGVLSQATSSRTSTSTGCRRSRCATTLIGGSDKMLVWNDLEPDEKIKVYDKGVDDHQRPRASTTCWSAIAPATSGRRRWMPPRR